MKKGFVVVMAACVVAAVVFVERSFGAPGDGCPHQQASQVEAVYKTAQEYETCGVGIKILGYGGSLIGERCARWEKIVPAYQVCRGEPLADHRCTTDRDLPVAVRTCECGGLVIPFIETGLPVACLCSDWFQAGWVEDMKTERCSDSGSGPDR